MPNDKPNILVIWGDDIGISNLSCYSQGLMGYRTPNIDRLAAEGMMFTDSCGEQSCTAGRSAFITGQSVYRTGLSKVGVPGAPVGLQGEDPRIATLLKPLGYATGQFGKNHLGDLNEYRRRSTASTSSSATSTTSTPRRSPNCRTTRPLRTSRSSRSGSDREACCTPGPRRRTTRRTIRAGPGSGGSGSRTRPR
jgi:arylsulfatase A-like enzyme